jgi:4-amino-4-deoxy-L-arabinose transferase-like glycosyltransferase
MTRVPTRSTLALWRSPSDQPAWARPALLGVAALAGLLYGWNMGSSIEIFYAAAVRSMSMRWHNFLFAAFDPAGTVSIDKLPGALWVQALSVRLLGVHTWAVALPQVLEGALTVLVLYRVVRRLAGPVAGIVAAGVLALSPAAVTLDRGNISDSLMVLLLVLAADSTVSALDGRRWVGVVMAGVWVGLAFQAKMLEAWLVLPALALTLLVASSATLWRRVLRLGAMAAVVAVVSLSWMVVVTLVPSSQRPYVDGSQHNSLFEQVFDYNGFGRVGQPSPNAELGRTLGIPLLEAPSPHRGWDRLLTGSYGRDTGWLIPAALVVAAVCLVARRRRPRTDPVRAGAVLWGTWLVTLAAVFSAGTTINSYYLAALAPAVAGLSGIAAVMAWDGRRSRVTRGTVGAVVVGTCGYAAWLLPPSGTGLPAWLAPAVLVLGIVTGGVLVASALVGPAVVGPAVVGPGAGRGPAWTAVALAGAGVAAVLVPVVASVSAVTETLGPFDTPFQSAATTAFTRTFFGAPLQSVSTLPTIEATRHGAPDLMATQTSVLAAPFIFATGQEVLPIGGYTGSIPAPTVPELAAMVASSRFHLVLAARGTKDPRITWIAGHCARLPPVHNSTGAGVIGPISIYYCAGGSRAG